jgi:hypothetical protein
MGSEEQGALRPTPALDRQSELRSSTTTRRGIYVYVYTYLYNRDEADSRVT